MYPSLADDGSERVVYTFDRALAELLPELTAATRVDCADEKPFRGTAGGGDAFTPSVAKLNMEPMS